jgi:hypothetical protein
MMKLETKRCHMLMPTTTDPASGIPAFKSVLVKLEAGSPEPTQPPGCLALAVVGDR